MLGYGPRLEVAYHYSASIHGAPPPPKKQIGLFFLAWTTHGLRADGHTDHTLVISRTFAERNTLHTDSRAVNQSIMVEEAGLQLQLPDFEESDFYVEQEQVSTEYRIHIYVNVKNL